MDEEVKNASVDVARDVLIANIRVSCSTERAEKLMPIVNIMMDSNAPASTRKSFHGAFDGGLILHTELVLSTMKMAWEGIKGNFITDISGLNVFHPVMDDDDAAEKAQLANQVTAEAIVTVALLHDLDKIHDRFGNAKYVPNVLKSGKASDSVKYKINEEYNPFRDVRGVSPSLDVILNNVKLQVPSGAVSLGVAEFISPSINAQLTDHEKQAIVFHAGLYEKGDKTGFMGNEHPLSILIHFADMMASRIGV